MKKPSFKELVSEFDTAMLVTRHESGMRARPMAIARADDDGTLWFITSLESGKVDELLEHPEVVVTCQKGDLFLSIDGVARVRKDRNKLETLWNMHFEAWFDAGLEDPQAVVIEIDAAHAEYWQQRRTQRIRYFFEFAKATLMRAPLEVDGTGDHGNLDLS